MCTNTVNHSIDLRGLKITPPIALAPMVGLTHSAFRTLVQGFGGTGLLFTEMLAAKRLPHDNPGYSPVLYKTAEEYPLIYQLVTGNIDHVGPAVEKLHSLGAQGIDLNLGCPAPMLKRQGAGASLVDKRVNLTKILRKIRGLTILPLSVKIRLGHREGDSHLLQFMRYLEDEGVDLITVHARLTGEKFCRKPRWHSIAKAKEVVNIPVIANGGIFSVEDAKRCLEVSGADGIMVGRGAVVRPWLCCEISEAIYGVAGNCSNIDMESIYFDFISLLEVRFREEKRLGRLKQFTHYYAKSFKFGHQLASAVQSSGAMAEAKEKATKFFLTVTQ